MHPDVVMWAKSKGRGHLCTLDTCLVSFRLKGLILKDSTFKIYLSSKFNTTGINSYVAAVKPLSVLQ